MAFTENSNEGYFTGTNANPCVLISAPSAGQRLLIRSIFIHVEDTNNKYFNLHKLVGSNKYNMWGGFLTSGDTYIFGDDGDVFILDNTNESLQGSVLSGTVTSLDTFNISWAIAS